jgi:acyl-coenzyme A synthetase/AMP-(fatty) acid ligase
VVDGVFHQPADEEPGSVARLGAFVVAPSLKPADILDALRQRIDPVFMPRPLVFVAELPRNTTGKLTHAAMQTLSQGKPESRT